MASYLIQWNYSPATFFEEAVLIEDPRYTVTISDGKIEAETIVQDYDQAKSLQEELTTVLHIRFLATQLIERRRYELSSGPIVHLRDDGTREYYIEVQAGAYVLTGGGVDFTVTSEDGNVIVDSKRVRIDRTNALGKLAVEYARVNPLSEAVLRSYYKAFADPKNELVHLYEIRDAFVAHYGDQNSAKIALGLSDGEWSDFGRICNKDPFDQGRHRGWNVGKLRPAAASDLNIVRALARKMIESYLK